MPKYDDLKNKQNELIRKALDGSVFIAPITASVISSLTTYSATATAAVKSGYGTATNIITAGNLVFSINGAAPVTVALAAADTPAAAVTKINTGLGANATASLVNGVMTVTSTATGPSASVAVVSGTGTVLSDTKLLVGTVKGSAAGIGLTPLPAGWDDLGWLTDDGASFSRSVSSSDITSWGAVTPTRSDVTSDTTSLSVTAQETKLLTIGLATGADTTGLAGAVNSAEVSIAKPARPSGRFYRALSVAVDLGDFGEIYVARFLPRAKVTGFSDQAYGGGDTPITWGVTLTGYEDSSLGYSERWLFGGDGWKALMADMGFPVVV